MRLFSGRAALYLLPIALLTIVPLFVVLGSLLQPQTEVWKHLIDYVLPDVLLNTAILIVGVGCGVLLVGVPLAWLTATCRFPGRDFFSWALMLPLAMPAYVLAFVMVDLLDYTGPVQTHLRSLFDSTQWFPRVRSTGGVIIIMTLAFYPYVYLLARNAFLTQGKRALEAAQSLGMSRHYAFWKISLPLARPWLIGGTALALMETLADFGTVSIFNFDTFTTAIYKSWFSLFNLLAASQLASLLVFIVIVLLALERWARGKRRYHGRITAPEQINLSKRQAWLACLACAIVLSIAFIIPFLQLLRWTVQILAEDFDERYLGFILRSMGISLGAALLVTCLALFIVYIQRRFPSHLTSAMVNLATVGYAIPGTVLAVGVFIPIAWLDNQLLPIVNSMGWQATQIFKGSVAIMLLALAARFMAVGFQPLDGAMQRISSRQEDAARTLGASEQGILRRIHIPLMRGGVLTAILMVFVEVMKEMPITLMTRPFGWDTLAVRVFEMTSEGMWKNAAMPSLLIVLAGILPVILLVKKSENKS